MSYSTVLTLQVVEGPIFRFAFALMILGLLRQALLATSDTVAGYLTAANRLEFGEKLRQRLIWRVAPVVLLRGSQPMRGRNITYYLLLSVVGVTFRACVVALPVFMVAHVYLWERWLHVGWPSLPGTVADALALVVIVSGVMLFLGRLYSPMLRQIEPSWTFFKPLILLAPFLTGFVAMHPTWSPFDYHVVRLVHVLSACVVFVLVPFARLLAPMHTPLEHVLPQTQWRAEPPPVRTAVQEGVVV